MLPLALSLVAAAAAVLAGRRRPGAAAPMALGGLALAFAAAVARLFLAREDLELPWAGSWDLQFVLLDDGLARLYVLLASGIGFLVAVYARGYLPHHLREQRRPRRHAPAFWALLALFAAAMAGLASAGDLVLLFFFFDLTAVCSYFLIGYDRQEPRARAAALLALLVTGIAAVLLLVAAVVAQSVCGTTRIADLAADPPEGAAAHAIAGLIAVAAIAKSAQVPLHFWLPRAMVAPTPVSAYLHSAAMVAAGVFLLQRTHPLIAASPAVAQALLWVGGASLLVGGTVALTRDALKQVLAYSTIAQYGYVLVLLGAGTPLALAAAAFHVPAHALGKCALFLVAGVVTRRTGADRLSETGGLGRAMPATAVAAAVAAGTIAGLPPTVGFFKDELLFEGLSDRNGASWVVAAGAALSVAYAARLWWGVFGGRQVVAARRPAPRSMTGPVLLLAALALGLGLWPGPLAGLAADAAGSERWRVTPGYHFDLRRSNVLALLAFALGAAVIAAKRLWLPPLRRFLRALRGLSPTHGYRTGLEGLNRLSDAMHGLEVRDLRDRLAAVLVPTGLLVLLGVWAGGAGRGYELRGLGAGDVPLAVVLALAALTGLAAATSRTHQALAILLALSGFLLAVAFALLGAPDVALVSVLVGTVTTLVVLAVLRLFPREVLRAARRTGHRRRDLAVGALATATALLLSWRVLSDDDGSTVATRYVELAPTAHTDDVVTAILADFRGLDTLGEATVVLVAMLGVAMLLTRPAGGPRGRRSAGAGRPPSARSTLLTKAAAAALLPLTLVVAAAILVKSHAEPGDGFAAGTVALTGVALCVLAVGHEPVRQRWWLRAAPQIGCGGLALMICVAFAPLLQGEPFLSHAPAAGGDTAHLGRLSLHTALLFDLGIAAAVYGFGVALIDRLAAVPEAP